MNLAPVKSAWRIKQDLLDAHMELRAQGCDAFKAGLPCVPPTKLGADAKFWRYGWQWAKRWRADCRAYDDRLRKENPKEYQRRVHALEKHNP